MPRVFQVGTVIEGAFEGKLARLSRKQTAKGVLDEFIKDEKVRDYSKRKYNEIQVSKKSGKRKWYSNKQEKLQPKYRLN